jgi:hypothetical protein
VNPEGTGPKGTSWKPKSAVLRLSRLIKCSPATMNLLAPKLLYPPCILAGLGSECNYKTPLHQRKQQMGRGRYKI